MPLLETEFLFGLRLGDRLYTKVSEILRLYEERRATDLKIATTGFLEVTNVLRARGFKPSQIAAVVGEMRKKIKLHSLEELSLNSEIIERCEELLGTGIAGLTYFDALHGSAAGSYDGTIISNDKIYDALNIKRLNFDEFVKKLAS